MSDRKYVVSQDRWCWCGRPAALVVMRRHNSRVVEAVCSDDHGVHSIKRIRAAETGENWWELDLSEPLPETPG